jgi:hypothetical protein
MGYYKNRKEQNIAGKSKASDTSTHIPVRSTRIGEPIARKMIEGLCESFKRKGELHYEI